MDYMITAHGSAFSNEAVMINKIKRALKTSIQAPLRLARTLVLCTCISSVAAASAMAGPHVHGQGQLSIAIEAEQVQLQLSMPAGDVVGFEHAPTNDIERSQILKAKAQFEDSAQLYVFNGAQCQINQVSVDMAGIDHSLEHEKKHVHTNIYVNYLFDCSNLKALSGISVNIFEIFPAITQINAQWISEQGQGSSDISAQARQVRF
jgi:hypothetical protein